jgi:ABC-type nickel/cobalt efflux system permease component RcnA
MASLLLIGLFIGMRHALEADHVAAVASLVTGKQSLRHTLKQGAVWGMGHTITLLLFGTVVILMDTVMPERLAHGLEMAVGVMLVLLGADVLRKTLRQKVHFHTHQHGDGETHFHAHSHAGDSHQTHDPMRHDHEHPIGFPFRALFVGLMHGMAGSAAVILLTIQTIQSPLEGVAYILVFGLGSMLGMALLSVVISIPLRLTAQRLTLAHNGLQLLVGVLTLSLGGFVVYENLGVLLA